MLDLAASEVWFVTGSQHLYGPETLETGRRALAEIAAALDAAPAIPVRVVAKPVLTGLGRDPRPLSWRRTQRRTASA